MRNHYKIIIVGAGPAGIAAAAAILQRAPILRHDLLVLEKSVHPRPKLCGGGLTPWADEMLKTLDLQVDVPSFQLENVAFYFREKPLVFATSNFMRTIRRDEFDAALLHKIRQRGVEIRENVHLQQIRSLPDKVEIQTNTGQFSADIVIGADGVKSKIRRQLMRENISRISRLLEVLVPIDERSLTIEFKKKMAVLDFTEIRAGLQGYIWYFPSFIAGKPYLNCGVFDARVNKGIRVDLPAMLRAHLQRRGFSPDYKIEGCPERYYHPQQKICCPRVVLTGDAAGIEPWLGEGISTALSFGPIVADTVLTAFDSGDFSFTDYAKRVRKSNLGWYLNRKRNIAQLIYRPGFYRFLPAFGKILGFYMRTQNNHPMTAGLREMPT